MKRTGLDEAVASERLRKPQAPIDGFSKAGGPVGGAEGSGYDDDMDSFNDAASDSDSSDSD